MIRFRSVAPILGLALALGLAAPLPIEAARRSHAGSDSARVVKRIEISDRGIEITDDDRDPSRPARRGKGVIEIGPSRVRVQHSADSLDEDLPGLTVNVNEGGLVRVFADAEVPAGDRVDGDVVAVFGSASVAGEVTGDVVAVFGSVRLEPGASAGGDVVAVGGVLDQDPEATVHGESISLNFMPMEWGVPGIQVMFGMVLFCWLVALVMGWLLHLLFPTRMMRIATTAARRPAASFFLGLFSAPLMVITIVLLLITVIGIPFAVVLPIVYVFGVWAGQIAVTYLLGCRLLRRPLGEGRSPVPLLAGISFVAAFFIAGAVLAGPPGASRTLALFFTLLGGLLILGLSALGSGSVLLSLYGTRPRDLELPVRDGGARPAPVADPAAAPVPPAVPGV